MERYTTTTVVDPAAIRERVRRVQLDGYAWTRDEIADGISSVAAALADEDGEVVAAVHLHGPSYRFPAPGAEPEVAAFVVASAGADLGQPAPGRRGPDRALTAPTGYPLGRRPGSSAAGDPPDLGRDRRDDRVEVADHGVRRRGS